MASPTRKATAVRAKAEDLDDEALAAVLDEIRTSNYFDPSTAPFTWDQIQHYLAETARRLDPRTRTA